MVCIIRQLIPRLPQRAHLIGRLSRRTAHRSSITAMEFKVMTKIPYKCNEHLSIHTNIMHRSTFKKIVLLVIVKRFLGVVREVKLLTGGVQIGYFVTSLYRKVYTPFNFCIVQNFFIFYIYPPMPHLSCRRSKVQ